MTKFFILTVYLILTALIVAYIDNGIRTHDLVFYHGKDNGYFVRFESIILLNTVFFILMLIGKNADLTAYLKQAGLGFVVAVILGTVCYFAFISADYYGLTYHISTIIICYLAYYPLKKLNWC